jgi:hypothetical protein
MKLLKFNEVIPYCLTNKCNAFAINEKKHEIFVYEYNDDPHIDKITLFYSQDSGSENESSGTEDFIDLRLATEDFPYIKNLTFFPFNKDDATYYNTIYYYASKSLLDAAKKRINTSVLVRL